MNRKPKLRFNGFIEDWEERKLGEIGKYITSQLSASDIDRFGKFDLYDANNVIGKTNKNIIREKYITIIKDGSGVGKVRLLNKNTSFIGTMGGILSSNSDVYFLYCILQNFDFTNYINGATIPHIYYSDYSKGEVKQPIIDEQSKIGSFFYQLDKLITSQQSKYDKLLNVKKSMLEKMFPKEYSKVPEIRFKGFTDKWEERKLEEVFNMSISNNTLSRSELTYENGEVYNIHYGDILVNYGSIINLKRDILPFIKDSTSELYKNQMLYNGDIIFADTAEDETVGKAVEITDVEEKIVVSGLHTIVCRPFEKKAKYYLGYYLNSNSFHNQLLPLMQGIKVLSLSKSNLLKTIVQYPKLLEEQQKIGSFFHQLDRLITLHKQKLEKLKSIKKSCLEKMFV